jgi:hypothetical protein
LKINRIAFGLTLALLGPLAVLAPASLVAQTVPYPALNAFQVTVNVNINNFVYTPVTIPAGQRLVVQNISVSGAAQTNGAYVQPIILISSNLNSGGASTRYFSPNPSATAAGQYYADYSTTLYADTLQVGPAFAGYTPSFMSFSIVITGYLVDLSQSQSCPPPIHPSVLPKELPFPATFK